MDTQSHIKTLQSGCAILNESPSETQIAQMMRYLVLMQKWNRKLNLTAVTQTEAMISHHLLDSLAALPFCRADHVLDIGTGAGLPGIPMAIMRPTWRFTLLDSRAKRVVFIRQVVAALKLNNVAAVHSRIEDWNSDQLCQTLVTRAFMPLDDMVDLLGAGPFGAERLVAMKGKQAEQEVKGLAPKWQTRVKLHSIQVPYLKAARSIVTLDF